LDPPLKLIFPESPYATNFERWDCSFARKPRDGKRVEIEDLGEVIWCERFDGSFHGRASL